MTATLLPLRQLILVTDRIVAHFLNNDSMEYIRAPANVCPILVTSNLCAKRNRGSQIGLVWNQTRVV